MKYTPLVLTVYNRPEHTKKTLDALARNALAKYTDLYIYSDGPKNSDDTGVYEVRKILKQVKGFKNVVVKESKKNNGLANSVISAVTEVVSKYGRVIVLEDDLVTQKYFLNVMNQMLDFYEEDKRIASVSAFRQSHRLSPVLQKEPSDVFFNIRPTSTGWGTWKNRWDKVDWDLRHIDRFLLDRRSQRDFNKGGKDLTNMLIKQLKGEIDSWAIRWTYYCFTNNLASVNTSLSYLDNTGHDSSGSHYKDESYFFQQIKVAEKKSLSLEPYNGMIDFEFLKKYYEYTSLGWTYVKRKLYSKLGILVK